MSVRGIHTDVTDMREKIFTEVARLAYEGGDYSRLEELPYKIVPGELASFRESVFTERAIVGERLRLAIGLPNRTLAEHAPVADGVNESAITERYYEPPLINIIKFACHKCLDNKTVVTNMCQGCTAHPCEEVCPKGAIVVKQGGKSKIDPEKCINCGRCRDAHMVRLLRWSARAQRHVVCTQFIVMSMAEQILITTSVYLVVCVL